MDDNKGTSVVLLNTLRGEELFEFISGNVYACDSSLEKAVAGNPCIVRSSKEHPRRAEFFSELDSCPLNDLIKKYCSFPSLHVRIYRKIRGILGRVKRMVLK